jgi:hypothetical protein
MKIALILSLTLSLAAFGIPAKKNIKGAGSLGGNEIQVEQLIGQWKLEGLNRANEGFTFFVEDDVVQWRWSILEAINTFKGHPDSARVDLESRYNANLATKPVLLGPSPLVRIHHSDNDGKVWGVRTVKFVSLVNDRLTVEEVLQRANEHDAASPFLRTFVRAE